MKVEERERKLYLGLTSDLQRKIKLPERDLKLTILHAARILQRFYPECYIQRLSIPESLFWENHQLPYRDWRGLACWKLSQIFSKSFLIPLEETDKCFELKVEHINLTRYAEMLVTADFHDDLDIVLESHSPAADINAKPPQLDVGYFNPSQRMIHTTRFGTPREKKFPWTQSYRHRVFDKLEIPLPIPHPAYVAISIFNRENDRDEIDLTDVHCQRIVRASQEVPYVDLSDLSSLDFYDPEVSTPDNATAESLTVVSHLAQQERTFSDDEDMTKSRLEESPFPDSPTSPTPDSEDYASGTEAGKLVYAEPEKDTSCMVFMDDEHIGAGIADFDIDQDP